MGRTLVTTICLNSCKTRRRARHTLSMQCILRIRPPVSAARRSVVLSQDGCIAMADNTPRSVGNHCIRFNALSENVQNDVIIFVISGELDEIGMRSLHRYRAISLVKWQATGSGNWSHKTFPFAHHLVVPMLVLVANEISHLGHNQEVWRLRLTATAV